TIQLEWATFQIMRRTHASLSRQAGIDPKLVADQLGHGLGVSLEVYTLPHSKSASKRSRCWRDHCSQGDSTKQILYGPFSLDVHLPKMAYTTWLFCSPYSNQSLKRQQTDARNTGIIINRQGFVFGTLEVRAV